VASRGQKELSEKEVAVLELLYDNPGSNYNTYGLTQALNPSVDPSSQEFVKPYNEVRTASERLIMLDLVDGNRLKAGDNSVYFSDLKLTKKGQRKAIEERTTSDKD
jgi:hypothetical protein